MNLTNLTFLVLLGSLASAPIAQASDFNGDGYADLAFGGTQTPNLGVVQVMYGKAGGLSSTGMQTLVAQTTPVISNPAQYDFGYAIAAGDFDNDGYDDLAVGAPFASFKSIVTAGCVNLFRGTPNGLVENGVLHQNKGGMKDKCELNDAFGYTLAAGDFDGNGFDDLAIGVSENVKKATHAGAVHVVYGSKKGLSTGKDQIWNQASKGVEGIPEQDEEFGSVLAAGDADGDGYAELAITIPGERTDHGGIEVIGAVALLRGSKKGLTSKNDALFDNADVNPSNYDPTGVFGLTLGFGDFDGDGKRHLVIGAPGWDVVAANSNDGAVFLVPITAKTVEFSAHVGLAIGQNGEYGRAIAVANFNGDAFDDLAIGAPHTSFLTGVASAGLTVVMRGSSTGLDVLNATYLTRNTTNVLGSANVGAYFGYGLASGDFDADGRADLVIAAPFDTVGTAMHCGGLNVLPGSPTSVVTGTNSQWWFGIPFGAPQNWQLMGLHLGS